MSTHTLAAQIAPQRSTQYAQLAADLAPHELYLSALRPHLQALESVTLGGQPYLKLTLDQAPDDALRAVLGSFAMTRAFFTYYDRLGEHDGPLLAPIDPVFTPPLPMDLALTRRYRGKTNELFTHFLCNVARHSSAFAQRPWHTLRLLDPLAGGGTTLFTALSLGADVVGVEQDAQNVSTSVAYLRDYMRGAGIGCQIKEEHLKKRGQRWWCTLKMPDRPRLFVYARGDTAQTDQLIVGFKKPHLIVTDLPYGIQHQGALRDLLMAALPVWAQVLSEGGALAFAWDATRFARADMIALVESACALRVLNDPPYDQLAHRVDRVIKTRDVIVARQP